MSNNNPQKNTATAFEERLSEAVKARIVVSDMSTEMLPESCAKKVFVYVIYYVLS